MAVTLFVLLYIRVPVTMTFSCRIHIKLDVKISLIFIKYIKTVNNEKSFKDKMIFDEAVSVL